MLAKELAIAAAGVLLAGLERIDEASTEELPMTHETRAGHKLELIGDFMAGALFAAGLHHEALRLQELTR